jgi:hypothetical protein
MDRPARGAQAMMMSALGQKRKYSKQGDVVCFASESGRQKESTEPIVTWVETWVVFRQELEIANCQKE